MFDVAQIKGTIHLRFCVKEFICSGTKKDFKKKNV